MEYILLIKLLRSSTFSHRRIRNTESIDYKIDYNQRIMEHGMSTMRWMIWILLSNTIVTSHE